MEALHIRSLKLLRKFPLCNLTIKRVLQYDLSTTAAKFLFFALQYFRANFILIFSAMFAKVYPLRLYGDLHVRPLKLLPKFSHFANFTAKMLLLHELLVILSKLHFALH